MTGTRRPTPGAGAPGGITIKSAAVSITIGDVVVNLVDTPGHPDFIAEVEGALGVLDGAVLVVSAVEGVQPQSRVLMRALRRLDLPTLLFVNKIDRSGAAYGGTLSAIRERLTPAAVAMGGVDGIGTVEARFNPFRAGNPLHSPAPGSRGGARRRPARGVRRGRPERALRAVTSGARRAEPYCPGVPGVLRLRDHRSGCGLADDRHPGTATSHGPRLAGRRLRNGVQGGAWHHRRAGRVRPDVLGCGTRPGPAPAR